MLSAWEKERGITDNAIPTILNEKDQTWEASNETEKALDGRLRLMWKSNVPGSNAPESIMTAAVQATENKGFVVVDGMQLVMEGFEALEDDNYVLLNMITSKLWNKIINAKKDENHPYWSYKNYTSFEDYEKNVTFPEKKEIKYDKKILKEKMYSGWLGQIIGGALGTAIEGYTTERLKEKFGDIKDYVRKPNTYNDDITYEIAFLKAYSKNKNNITSEDVALSWVGYVPTGWSAEEIALKNISSGIFPPKSGIVGNPFTDWIGAQMRGAICGQLAPGNPREAARLAWIDGQVSHSNNGIIGELFNAVLVSLSYVEDDIRLVLDKTVSALAKDSEYYEIVKFAYTLCKENSDWQLVWKKCEERVKKYNWIHSYPNVMAEIVALYYGENDFDRTMNIIAMCGQDVDCNAAQIMTALGVIVGADAIDDRWKKPIGDDLITYCRHLKNMSISGLAEETFNALDSKYKKDI